MCIGTSLVISIGRSFNIPPGTHFAWRSRLWVYNPRTGKSYWTAYSGLFYDQTANASGYITLSDGTTLFVMGPSGGILPAYSPTSVWTVTGGLYVTPYVQVIGYGEAPVNITDVDYGSRYSAPNWCYFG